MCVNSDLTLLIWDFFPNSSISKHVDRLAFSSSERNTSCISKYIWPVWARCDCFKYNAAWHKDLDCLKSLAKSHAGEMTLRLTSFCPERTSSRANSITPSLMSSNKSFTSRGGTCCQIKVSKTQLSKLSILFFIALVNNNYFLHSFLHDFTIYSSLYWHNKLVKHSKNANTRISIALASGDGIFHFTHGVQSQHIFP